LEDYTVRLYRAWKVGLQGKDNGAVLFVFVKEHKLRIATGYGLEGALPDAICKRILDDEITPRLKQGDFDGGMTAGVNAMIAATKGEYKGTGRTVADNANGGSGGSNSFSWLWTAFVVFAIIMAILRARAGGGTGFGGSGWWLAANVLSGWNSGGGGGGWSGGGGGGSGAMGGGGSTGGGGASGSW
jgi:uncharacterized protein